MAIKVEVAVYDLSRGMASMMSEQILGQRIDGIWHTGVVVFGIEYYFGGGIQSTPSGIFAAQNNIPCNQLLNIGNTTKTRSELEAYLRSIRSQFSMSTYDLINNNCNNFCDTVCKFLTINNMGIPSYIVDLPRIVFSTPGGAMLRPMIESMQSSIHQQQSSMDPFGNISAVSAYANSTSSFSPYSQPAAVSSFAPTTATGGNNANHVSTASEALRAAEFENRLSEGVMSTITTALINNTTDSESLWPLNSTIIDQPLTFSDVGNLRLLMDKVIITVNNNATAADNYATMPLLSECEVKSLYAVVDILLLKSDSIAMNGENGDDNAYALFLSLSFTRDPTLLSSLSYLSLLRLVVLRPSVSRAHVVSHTLLSIIIRLIAELKDTSGEGLYKPPAVSSAIRAVAMSVLVNYLSLPYSYTCINASHYDDLLDIATVGLSHSSDSKVTLRMTASALAVNITITCTTSCSPTSSPTGINSCASTSQTTALWKRVDSLASTFNNTSSTTSIAMSSESEVELHPHAVQMLCSVIECLSDSSSNDGTEVNQTIRLRELVIVYRLLHHCGHLAVSLATDLGLVDLVNDKRTVNLLLTAHHQHMSGSANNIDVTLRKDEAVLVKEIRKLLSHQLS